MAERKKSKPPELDEPESEPLSSAEPAESDDGPVDPESKPEAQSEPESGSPATLRVGDRGDDVRRLQRELNQRGARVQVDGIFTSKLSRTLARAQRELGIDETGELDPETRAALGT